MSQVGPYSFVKKTILGVETRLLCHASFFRRIPVFRALYRSLTAELQVLPPEKGIAVGFRVDFKSPYFRLPIQVAKGQIGRAETDGMLEPAAFRAFDWRNWAHIPGRVKWHGDRRVRVTDGEVELISGFSYLIPRIPETGINLGLRLAEGVEGAIKVACGRSVAPVSFQPVFWLLESSEGGFRPVPIRTNKLMGLIVSLFDLGSGKAEVAEDALARLCQWTNQHVGNSKPFTGTGRFLAIVRDWGPLALAPLYPRLIEVFRRLEVKNVERELFEFVADNWGIHDNRKGRLLAITLLGELKTPAAASAISAVHDLVKSGNISAKELEFIRYRMAANTDRSAISIPENLLK